MGSTFSYFMSGQTQPDPSLTLPTAERRDPPYLGLGVPEEASHTREDSHGWYTDFFDILRVAVHQDQESLIVFNPKHNRPRIVQLSDEEDEGEDEDEEGAVAAYAELMYKRLFDEPNESESGSNSASSKAGQKRIVRYLGPASFGFRIERLHPGPLVHFLLPGLTSPLPSVPNPQDRVLLALYYRWALQALSALSFCHSKSVFLCDFSFETTWVRWDLSLAITGFPNAETYYYDEEEKEQRLQGPPYDSRRSEGYAWSHVGGFGAGPGIQYDLFDWATWVWRLMINDHSIARPANRRGGYEPVDLADGEEDDCTAHPKTKMRFEQRAFQRLERRRLGEVLLKAWNGKYEDANEVSKDVVAVAQELEGVVVDGDEVTLDGVVWSDCFTIVPSEPDNRQKELRFVIFGDEKWHEET